MRKLINNKVVMEYEGHNQIHQLIACADANDSSELFKYYLTDEDPICLHCGGELFIDGGFLMLCMTCGRVGTGSLSEQNRGVI